MRFLSGAMYRQKRSDLFAQTAYASDKNGTFTPLEMLQSQMGIAYLRVYVDFVWTKFSFAPKFQRFCPYTCGGCPTVHVNPCIHQIWSHVQNI